MAWTSAHYMFAVEMIFTTGKSVIVIQKVFHAHFMLHLNDAVPDRKLILLWNISELQVHQWIKTVALYLNNNKIYFLISVILGFFLSTVKNMSDPSQDCNWLYLKIKRKILARWSYHCYLAKLAYTTHVIVWNIGGISVISYTR